MKVFISWSGDISHKVAMVLYGWLPDVIQSIDPYVSSEDIHKGTRWIMDISTELEKSAFGILLRYQGQSERSLAQFRGWCVIQIR